MSCLIWLKTGWNYAKSVYLNKTVIRKRNDIMVMEYECDNCLEGFEQQKPQEECPNCGADAVSKVSRELEHEDDNLQV